MASVGQRELATYAPGSKAKGLLMALRDFADYVFVLLDFRESP